MTTKQKIEKELRRAGFTMYATFSGFTDRTTFQESITVYHDAPGPSWGLRAFYAKKVQNIAEKHNLRSETVGLNIATQIFL